MLICVIYAQGIYAIGIYAQGIFRTAISTGTKNRIFVLRQFKLEDTPAAGQTNPISYDPCLLFKQVFEVLAYLSSKSKKTLPFLVLVLYITGL
jgi:hypothetical protein